MPGSSRCSREEGSYKVLTTWIQYLQCVSGFHWLQDESSDQQKYEILFTKEPCWAATASFMQGGTCARVHEDWQPTVSDTRQDQEMTAFIEGFADSKAHTLVGSCGSGLRGWQLEPLLSSASLGAQAEEEKKIKEKQEATTMIFLCL